VNQILESDENCFGAYDGIATVSTSSMMTKQTDKSLLSGASSDQGIAELYSRALERETLLTIKEKQ
jgi:hypothetical protein